MWAWVDRLGGALLDAGLAAAVLTGVAALLMVGCRQPARRSVLARATILGALAVIPLAGLGPPRPRLEVLGPLRAIGAPLLGPWPTPPEGAERPDTPGILATIDLPAGAMSWAGRSLTLAYLVGVLAGLGWLALGWWYSGWLVRRATEPAGASRSLYEGLPFDGPRPRLRVSRRIRRPMLLGIARPTILIPPGLEQPEAHDRLRLGLLHELVHADRRDAWFRMLGGLAQATWFVLPWVWWIGRQMRLDQEFLADHRASIGFGPIGAYASSLVDLAAPDPAAGPVASPPARDLPAWGVGSALYQRIVMLLRCPYPVEAQAPLWWRRSLPAIVACGTVLASGLTLRSAEPSPARSPAPIPGPRSFRMPRLVVAEAPAGPDGWTPPHDLIVALPARFALSLEVWAVPSDLARIRVAGYRLAPSPTARSTGIEAPTWHPVQIRRDARGAEVLVDGRALPAHVIVADEARPRPTWLNIQTAPDQIGLFRDLALTW